MGRRSLGDTPIWPQARSIEHFSSHFDVDAPIQVVREFHSSTNALPILTPPPLSVRTLQGGEVIEGMVAKFRLHFGPFGIEWHARHEDVQEDSFVDVQAYGPLAHWRHTHRFESLGPNRTRVHDHVAYEFHKNESLFVRLFFSSAALRFLFAFRSRQTRKHCKSLNALPPRATQLETSYAPSSREARPSRG